MDDAELATLKWVDWFSKKKSVCEFVDMELFCFGKKNRPQNMILRSLSN